MKKLASLLLALVMIMSCFSAMAANVTVEGDKLNGHDFTAYQIFTGSQGDSETALGNVEWGEGIDSIAFLAELKKAEIYAACTTAADVADVLAANKTNAAVVEAFAQLAYNFIVEEKGDKLEPGDNVLADGYYLIVDTTAGEVKAYNAALLQVTRDITITTKMDYPTLDKVIVENGEDVTINEGSIGDEVNYKLTSKVPDMAHYEKYFFIVEDTLSEGLTFNEDVIIKIGEKTLVKDTDYTVTVNDTKIEIVFKNFIQHAALKGQDIIITYSATINEKAKIVNEYNPNTADLIYSNNPNEVSNGTSENPDKPDSDDPVGKTPEATVKTYVTELTIKKIDEDGNILTGAEFSLTGNGVNIVLVSGEEFVENAEGTYYKLNDGTYTETEPTDETNGNYASTETKYALTTVFEAKTNPTEGEVAVKGYVNEDGTVTFRGLGAGDYIITETVTPAGYNTIAPINFTISFKVNEDETVTFSTNNDKITVNSDNTLEITIENVSGATLPETGGMGTTILYVGGGILVLAAIVLLIVKRRASAE